MSTDEARQRLQEYSEEGWRAAYAAAQAAKRLQDRLSTPIDIYSQPVADDIAQVLDERDTLHARIADAALVQLLTAHWPEYIDGPPDCRGFECGCNEYGDLPLFPTCSEFAAHQAALVAAYLIGAPDDEATT